MKYLLLLTITTATMISNYETQKYDVVLSEDNFEIRFYDSSLKAKVSSDRSANGNFYNWYSQVIIWGDSDEAPSRVEVLSNSAGVLTGTTDPYDGYYVILVKE